MKDEKLKHPGHIFIDRKKFDWKEECITGLQLKELAGIVDKDYNIWHDVLGSEDILIEDDTKVDLTGRGSERFFTGKKTSTEGWNGLSPT